jgi:exosortase D (VPLPA-CTERM-specific)
LGITLALWVWIFLEPAESIASAWFKSAEYNYGPIVPVLAALMIWRNLEGYKGRETGGWLGVVLVVVGLVLGLIWIASKIAFAGQLGLFLCVVGFLIGLLGENRSLAAWPGIAFLFFALPMASLVQIDLTYWLQQVSSRGGVAIIQVFGIPVYREGNIIDLGQFKLQVAEACSGLRYLLPLSTFSFLCAYLFRGNLLQRAIIFVSALPITVAMNIVRIGITGILVDRYGLAAAEGFFHDFEGWAVFGACLAVLLLEMKLICLFAREDKSLINRLNLDLPKFVAPAGLRYAGLAPLIAILILSVGAAGLSTFVDQREPAQLARSNFASFPRAFDGWEVFDAAVDQKAIDALQPSDYLSLNFVGAERKPVNVWLAYYATQQTGTNPHSPRLCIPGGGWEIESMSERSVPSLGMSVNRLTIRRGNERQLVYYWFMERGKAQTSEYWSKFHLLVDGLVFNRTDGGLLRFVTPIFPNESEAAAETRLVGMLGTVQSTLTAYFPR